MKQVNVLSLYELNKYVRAVAAEAGLNVQISSKPYSYLHGTTLYIAPEKAPLNPERAMYQLRKVIHEVAHHTDSDMKLWDDVPLTQESPLRSLWNVVEDHRIEHVQSKRYDGDADILDAGTSASFGVALKSAGGLPPLPDPKKQAEVDFLVASLKLDRDARAEWMPSMHEHDITLTPSQQAIYDKLAPHLDELRQVRKIEGKEGTAAAYELAKKMYTDMGGDPEQEEEKGKAAAKKGKAAGHGESGGNAGEGVGEGAAVSRIRGMLTTSPQEDGENPLDKADSPGGLGKRGVGRATAALPQEFYVDNLANPHKSQIGSAAPALTRNYSGSYEYNEYTRDIAAVRADASTSEQLAQRMRRLVQIRTRSRYQYGLKQGKLHGANLHRIVSNVPGYSERVFKRKESHLDIDSAVCVCVDLSGSMHGPKACHAIVAAEMLSETVGNALGIPLQIYGFSEAHGPVVPGATEAAPEIYVLRDFNERQVNPNVFRHRGVVAIANTMGNNPDADAVIWGYHQLRAAKGKRKILFVLSDGSPASNRSGNQSDYLKSVTSLIEKSPIKLFGVGLMSDSVKHFYKNNVVVNDAKGIETKLIELVDNFILQGQ